MDQWSGVVLCSQCGLHVTKQAGSRPCAQTKPTQRSPDRQEFVSCMPLVRTVLLLGPALTTPLRPHRLWSLPLHVFALHTSQ